LLLHRYNILGEFKEKLQSTALTFVKNNLNPRSIQSHRPQQNILL
jgi:hypothetical protein